MEVEHCHWWGDPGSVSGQVTMKVRNEDEKTEMGLSGRVNSKRKHLLAGRVVCSGEGIMPGT